MKAGCLWRILKVLFLFFIIAAIVIAILVIRGGGPATAVSSEFGPPEAVTVRGYDDHIMEPFLSRDGEHLFFNNSNAPGFNTDLHWARRRDDLEFDYLGPLAGINTASLEGVPTLTVDGELFFVSTRVYDSTSATVFRGRLASGTVSEVVLVPGIGPRRPVWVEFDVEVSPDGRQLFVAGGWFAPPGLPITSDLRLFERGAGLWVAASDSERILAQVNTPALEYAAGLSGDGKELFFTRLGTPPIGREAAIFLATRTSGEEAFGPPVRLAELTGFVEGPTLSPDGNLLYFHRLDGERYRLYVSRRRRP